MHGPLRDVVLCHCVECRRWSGYAGAFTATRTEHLVLTSDDALRWIESPESARSARRGYCAECGSNLFWAPASGERLCVMAGTLDQPTGLSLAMHVFVNDAGDYYRITDGLPTRVDGDHGIPLPQS